MKVPLSFIVAKDFFNQQQVLDIFSVILHRGEVFKLSMTTYPRKDYAFVCQHTQSTIYLLGSDILFLVKEKYIIVITESFVPIKDITTDDYPITTDIGCK